MIFGEERERDVRGRVREEVEEVEVVPLTLEDDG